MSADFSNQFFQQVIPFFIITVFVPFALLIVYTMIKYYLRAQRKKQNPSESAEPAYAVSQPGGMSQAGGSSFDTGELPSLDDLITSSVAADPSPEDVVAPVESDLEDLLPDLDDELALDEATLPDFEDYLEEHTEAEEVPSQPEEHTLPDGAQHVALNTGDVIAAAEVLTILRDADDDRLMIVVDGTGYRTLSDAPETKKIFTSIMKELSSVITKPDTREPGTVKLDVPPPPPKKAAMPQATPDPKPQPTVTKPPPAVDGSMPGDLPSYKIEDNPINVEKKGRFGRKLEYDPVPDLDIGQAIEAYLQHKLLHTTEFDGRNIHVRTAPTGGISIQVDNNYYDAVSDVEDEGVREFLSATIQEWQDRQ